MSREIKFSIAREIKLGLSVLALLAAGIIIKDTYSGMRKAEAELNNHPAYVRARQLGNVNRGLSYVIFDLDYTPQRTETKYHTIGDMKVPYTVVHPPIYPDCKDARIRISSALEKLGDTEDIDDKLREVHDSLPEQNDVKIYNNRDVDDSTFNPQIDSIQQERKRIRGLKDSLMGQLPEGIVSRRNWNAFGFITSILGGLSAVGFGIYNFFKKN